MSGCYGNRKVGHGCRGGGRGQGRSTKREIYKKRATADYLFYVGSSKKASYYKIIY